MVDLPAEASTALVIFALAYPYRWAGTVPLNSKPDLSSIPNALRASALSS